jgi:hypothetical protein
MNTDEIRAVSALLFAIENERRVGEPWKITLAELQDDARNGRPQGSRHAAAMDAARLATDAARDAVQQLIIRGN